jgi:hypothetical protein
LPEKKKISAEVETAEMKWRYSKEVYLRCRDRKGMTTKEPESVKHKSRVLWGISLQCVSTENACASTIASSKWKTPR